MRVAAITSVNGAEVWGNLGGNIMRRAAVGMAYHKHVTVHGFQRAQGVAQGFTLAGGRGGNVQV